MPDDILSRQPPSADARLVYGPDPNQFVDMRFPAQDKNGGKRYALVINIHGGFWRSRYNLDHAGHLCAALARQGFVAANVEYRRVGNDGGGWPGTFADIRSAHQFLTQQETTFNLDLARTVVMGHSAGGQLALCLAAHEASVSKVVCLAGVVDLRRAYELHLSHDAVAEFLHGTPREVPDHYREADPMEFSIPHAKQRIIQGSVDDVVPSVFSRDYVAAKEKRTGGEKEDVHLLEIAGAGHFDLIDPESTAWKSIEKTLMQLSA
jgi:acetyl esterase/lipase